MQLPIASFLKSRSELETAKLEDDVVGVIANITGKVALHGGTAVWRCYGGKRFSRDIDAYVWYSDFRKKFIGAAARLGIEVSKFREKRITYINVRKGDTEIKIESNNVERNAILVPYERVDGSKINILALSPEDLILEKIDAYMNRRAYKDLYDITVLLNSVKEPGRIRNALRRFAESIQEPDEDFQSYSQFRSVIYAGTAPAYERMAELVKRWLL